MPDRNRIQAGGDVEPLGRICANDPRASVGRLTNRRDRSIGSTRAAEEAQEIGRERLPPERRLLFRTVVGRHGAAIADHVGEAAGRQHADVTPETGAGHRLHCLLLAAAGTNLRGIQPVVS